MIEICNISVKYDRFLFDHVTIQLNAQEITLLEGKSGTGKTTLLYIIGMLLRPKGTVYKIDGKEIKDESLYKSNISYVTQGNDLIDYLTVEEHFLLSSCQNHFTQDEMKFILEYVDLEISLDQNIKTLSSGERQRLAIAIALIQNTQIILLDEPTAYLDSERSLAIMKLLDKIAKDGKVVVIASHDKMVESFARKIYYIENPKIVEIKNNFHNKEIKLNNQHYDFHYYFTYIKYYVKHHSNPILLNILLIALCSTFMIISSSVVDEFLNQQDKNLQDLSTNQILMINSNQSQYDEEAPLLDNHIIQEIRNIEGVQDVYGYREIFTDYGYDTIMICPYRDSQDFQHYTNITFNDNEKYFINDAMYRMIHSDKLVLGDKTYKISAVLKKGYNASYNMESRFILYVPLEEIEIISGNYIVVLDNYKKIGAISQQLESDYRVSIANKEDSSLLLSSYELAKTVGTIMTVIVCVISSVFLLIINYQAFKNQIHAFSFLKINSNDYIKIILSHYLLVFIEGIVIWFIYMILQYIAILLMIYCYHIAMPYHIEILQSIRTIILLMLIVNIPTIYFLHLYNPIRSIR